MLTVNNSITGASADPEGFTNAPLRLAKSVQLHAPQDTVFALVADHERVPELFPWVQCVTVDNSRARIRGGLGARRACNFGNGLVLEEVIVGWEPSRMYAYAGVEETHPFGMKGHVGLVTCEQQSDGQSILTWRHYFDHPNPQAMQEKMECSFKQAVQSLIKRFGGKLLDTYINFK